MKALRFRAPWRIELSDEPEPTPRPEEVVLEVDAVGICGSDVHDPSLSRGYDLAVGATLAIPHALRPDLRFRDGATSAVLD